MYKDNCSWDTLPTLHIGKPIQLLNHEGTLPLTPCHLGMAQNSWYHFKTTKLKPDLETGMSCWYLVTIGSKWIIISRSSL